VILNLETHIQSGPNQNQKINLNTRTCTPLSDRKLDRVYSDVIEPSLREELLESLPNPWSHIETLHCPGIQLPPLSNWRVVCEASVARLDIQIVLCDLDPATRSKQYPRVLDVRQPSTTFYAGSDESRMNQVASSCLKDIWVVETVV
jgi:hypothetical protein